MRGESPAERDTWSLDEVITGSRAGKSQDEADWKRLQPWKGRGCTREQKPELLPDIEAIGYCAKSGQKPGIENSTQETASMENRPDKKSGENDGFVEGVVMRAAAEIWKGIENKQREHEFA